MSKDEKRIKYKKIRDRKRKKEKRTSKKIKTNTDLVYCR